MKLKKYIAPDMATYSIATEQVLMGSKFDDTKSEQNITPTDEEYGGEFKSRRKNVWDEEEEEEENSKAY